MSDPEEEYEEKEYTVYLDFETYIAPDELDNPCLDFKVIGIDAENPVVQLNGKIFKGTYDFTIGTHVFFEEDPNLPVVDPLYESSARQFYRICAKTQKMCKMERIYIEKIVPNDKPSECEKIRELKEQKIPNTTYTDALNTILPMGCVQPRLIKDDYLPRISTDEMEMENLNIVNRYLSVKNQKNESGPEEVPEASTSSMRRPIMFSKVKQEKSLRPFKMEKGPQPMEVDRTTVQQEEPERQVQQQETVNTSLLRKIKQEK